MNYDNMRKWLALDHHVRRKKWKKHIRCTGIYQIENRDYMKLYGFPKHQRVTDEERKAIDWEKC